MGSDSGFIIHGSTPGSTKHAIAAAGTSPIPVRYAQGRDGCWIPYLTEERAFVITCELLHHNDCWHSEGEAIDRSLFLSRLSEQLGSDFYHEDYLIRMYENVKAAKIEQGVDHTAKLDEIQQTILIGTSGDVLLLNTPANLDRYFVLRHRVCLDQPTASHVLQYDKELFIFNDILIIAQPITPVPNKYRFCSMAVLLELEVTTANSTSTGKPALCVIIARESDHHVVMRLYSRDEEDRDRIFRHLKDSIMESKMTYDAHQWSVITDESSHSEETHLGP